MCKCRDVQMCRCANAGICRCEFGFSYWLIVRFFRVICTFAYLHIRTYKHRSYLSTACLKSGVKCVFLYINSPNKKGMIVEHKI